MPDDLKAGLVRICLGSKTWGTGFAVAAEGLIATCAHVVEKVRTGPDNDTVRLIFHATGAEGYARVEPAWWRGSEAEDVAILRLLEGSLPVGVVALPLGASTAAVGQTFTTFGFPAAMSDGLNSRCEVIGWTTENDHPVLQVRGSEIRPGFSGAPVWDEHHQVVIGMVVSFLEPDPYRPATETAFIIPSETLQRICPTLPLATISLSHPSMFDRLIPPLPDSFILRPEVIQNIKACLLTDTATGADVHVIHGLAGVGKSTLMAAIVRESDVRAFFADRILWATLGGQQQEDNVSQQKDNVLPHLHDWLLALGDEHFNRFTDKETASSYLGYLLKDKATLLVVDDVWDEEQVTPFLKIKKWAGPNCRVVITTRDALVVEAELIELGVMSPEQALALLTEVLKRELEGEERKQAQDLAKTVGYLPLALQLAAAQISEPSSWAKLLTDLGGEIARLDKLNKEPGWRQIKDETRRKRLSLIASFNLSLQRLSKELFEAFAWLGVLPEDATIVPAVASTLWKTDEQLAQDTLHDLKDKALLLTGFRQNKSTHAHTYRLHDMAYAMARLLLTNPPKPVQNGDLPG